MTTNINLLYENPEEFIKAGYEGVRQGEHIYRFNVPVVHRSVTLGFGISLQVPRLDLSMDVIQICNLLGLLGLRIRTFNQIDIDGNLMGMTFYCQEKK
jgi:hypothetical protein